MTTKRHRVGKGKRGRVVRYVGVQRPQLAGMEGRVVIPQGTEDPSSSLVQWATHDRALRQRGTDAHWESEWVRTDDLKPISKLTKGFAFYEPVRDEEGNRGWKRTEDKS
jgi:hypothetical protein